MPLLKQPDPISLEELTISNMYELEALIEVLARRGTVSNEEVLEEIKKMRGLKK